MSELFFDELIDASLDPQRLDHLEKAWEEFLDESFQRFTRDDQSESLARNVERALEILSRLNFAMDRQRSAQQMADMNPGAATVVSSSGEIMARNNAFERYFGATGHLSALDDLDGFLRWIRMDRSRRGSCHFEPAMLDDDRQAIFLCVAVEGLTASGNEVFFITELDILVQGENVERIMDAYGLTRAEAEVCIQLANGLTPAEISRLREVSIHTVRSQIKFAIDKTGAKNSTDLVRGLCGLAARFSYIQHRTDAAEVLGPPVEPSRKVLRDGRVMSYFEQGDPFGFPVVYLHSLWDGPVLYRPFREIARHTGLRVIGVSRPGFGQSDPGTAQDLDASLDSFCEDLIQLLDQLKIERVVVVGQHHALRFASRHGNQSVGLIHINGLPVWTPEMLNALTDRRRNLVKTSLQWPGAVRLLVRIGMALLKGGREDLFLWGLAKGSKPNADILRDPQFMEHARFECRHHSAQGVEPFLLEVPLLHSDNAADLGKVRVPVRAVLYGDRSHTPDVAVKSYRASVPSLEVSRAEDHAQLS